VGRSKIPHPYSAVIVGSPARGFSQAHLQKVFIGGTGATLPDVFNGLLETQLAAPIEIGHGYEG
jgi:hypothetical protein